MPHFTAQWKKKKFQTAWLTCFGVTIGKTWDMKPLLAGQHAVIYQTRQVLLPLQSENSECLWKHLGQGCFLHISVLSLCVIVVLVLDSTQNCSKFPECWFGFLYQYNKGSQTKGFFLYAPQWPMITLSCQWIPSISHMALTLC